MTKFTDKDDLMALPNFALGRDARDIFWAVWPHKNKSDSVLTVIIPVGMEAEVIAPEVDSGGNPTIAWPLEVVWEDR